MAEQLTPLEIAINTGNAAQSIGDLKESIRELKNLAVQAGDENSEAYIKATQAAGKLADKIEDISDATKTFKGDPLESLSKGIGTLKGKLMDLDFAGFNDEMGRLSSIAGGLKFKDFASAVGDTTKSFVQLGRVLLTNPIFLIASAIALAIANLDTLLGLIDGVSSAEQERLDLAKETAAASKEQLDSITAQEERLRANGVSEEEILQKKIDAARVAALDAKAQIDAQKVIRDEQVAAAERNKRILKGILEFVTIPLQALLYGVDQLTEGLKNAGIISEDTYSVIGNLREKFNEGVSSMVFDPKKVEKEGNDAVKAAEKTYTDLDRQLAGYENKQKSNREKAAEKAAADQKAKDDKKLADEKAAREAYAKANMDAQENELYELQQAQTEQLAAFTGSEEARLLLIESYAIREQEIMDKYDQIAAAADQKAKDDELARQKVIDDQKLADQQKYIDAEIAAREQLVAAENKLSQDKATAVSAGFELLNAVFGKNKKVQNALFLAQRAYEASQVVINGLKNATILKGQIAVATPLLSNPATATAAGYTIAAASKGLISNALTTGAGVASILATTIGKFVKPDSSSPSTGGGGGGGGNEGGGGGGAPAPTFTPPQFFGLGQGQLQGGVGGPQTQQVVVLENDITRTQNRVRVIENRSIIG